MRVGIPKALLYFQYPMLYTKFFKYLGVDVVLSDDTNIKIVEDGIKNSIDESCLASKIFMGHVINLMHKSDEGKIDYIFIPRVSFFGKRETVCVKFYALIDVCNTVFNYNFITLNIDYTKGENELTAFTKLGKKLGKSRSASVKAYLKAKIAQKKYDQIKYNNQIKRLKKFNRKNILIVSHPYIVYDNFLGKPIINYLKKNNVNVYYADINSAKLSWNNIDKFRYKEISKSIYWKYNKDLLNGTVEFKDKMDGILFLSVFPCGTDALVNEIAIRKINNIPTLNIILDEQKANAGIVTRLESFIDILEQKSKVI